MKPFACFLLLCLAAGPASADTIRALLARVWDAPGQPVSGVLTGKLADELAPRLGGAAVLGTARLVEPLEQPGCGRVEIVLTSVAGSARTELAAAKLDLCRDGGPPDR